MTPDQSRISAQECPPLRIVWFPHAGSRAASYASWASLLPGQLQHTLVEYPGHGARGGSPLRNMDSLVSLLVHELPLGDTPFAFFGHSMGGLVAFAVAAELQRLQRPLPVWLGVSGRNGPDFEASLSAPRSNAQLIAMMRMLGGTPEGALDDAREKTLLLQRMRADLEAIDSFHAPLARLPVPICAYYARDDVATRAEAVLTWSWWTSSAFTMRRFPGGHFFPFERRREFADCMLGDLCAHADVQITRPDTRGVGGTAPSLNTSPALRQVSA